MEEISVYYYGPMFMLAMILFGSYAHIAVNHGTDSIGSDRPQKPTSAGDVA
jgi:hypothetical protein